MSNFFEALGALAVVMTLAVILGLVMSFPTYLLWNDCLVPAVHGVNEIGWLQAWGLNILFGILFRAEVKKK
jgi:hypothetical protein